MAALAGLTVGIRSDRTWRSFEWVADEWERLLCRDEVLQPWCRAIAFRTIASVSMTRSAAFVDAADLAIVGLGN